MSTPNIDDQPTGDETTEPAEYGSLTVEDDPDGTVDPSELAGTADDDDEDVS
ncbi:MAG TPA: hypothetical protein VIT20_08625 [Propionibacteriaceae bacterium]